MVEIKVGDVKGLQELIDDASIPLAERARGVRRFCNTFKPSAPQPARGADDEALWTKVDTDHLLAISSDLPKLSNYLVERVVAAA